MLKNIIDLGYTIKFRLWISRFFCYLKINEGTKEPFYEESLRSELSQSPIEIKAFYYYNAFVEVDNCLMCANLSVKTFCKVIDPADPLCRISFFYSTI